MEYPVCLADSCVGTLYVCPRGEETELRAVCRGTEKGLYRLYVQGNRGEVLLGVTEDGGLRRCFSRELLAPAGELRRGVLRPCGGEAPERRGFLSRLPEICLLYPSDAAHDADTVKLVASRRNIKITAQPLHIKRVI